MPGRVPTMQSSLSQLLDCGVPVSSVLDVGILTGTQPLIDVLAFVPHHLFEPVDLHFAAIQSNYRNIDHTLHQVALSDSDGSCYLECRSIHGDNTVTHAEVVDQPVDGQAPGFISCTQIIKSKLDTIVQRESINGPYLLKIDVDGHEMEVMHGAEDTLKDCSIVVIEAPLNRVPIPHFFERSRHLMSKGFFLMDIVDLAYYDGTLWQVDLVFVRHDLAEQIERLRPFETTSFSFNPKLWTPLDQQVFR